MNKKAQFAESKLANLILTLMAIGILFGGIYLMIEKGQETATIYTCRNSVLLKSQADLEIGGVKITEKATPLICKTEDLQTLTGTRDEIKYQIADAAAKCWYQYAEGKIPDLFKAKEDQKKCGICYYFKIDGVKEEKIAETTIISEPKGRQKNNISKNELYNYLMLNEYNPGLVYGGGTKRIIGQIYEGNFKFDITTTVGEVDLREIDTIPGGGYISDYTGYMDQEDKKEYKNKINKMGNELLIKDKAQLLITIADEIEDLSRSKTNEIIDRLNLNTDEHSLNAILLIVDLENEEVRLHLGVNLEPYMTEQEIKTFLKENFEDQEKLEVALLNTIEKIYSRLNKNNQEEEILKRGVLPKSYYMYMLNDGNFPLIISDIEPGRTYAISYSGTTDEISFFKDFFNELFSFNLEWAPSQIGDVTYDSWWDWLTQNGKITNPNNLIISKSNEITKYCEEMK
ncbi:hypothetical protein K9L67_03670 [Candidatus Woesearchaeota archaeon]|nr:hypothetical protein [Candidatus Woesearchaeota archaeon]MCF7901300.1 hypothetical protein [Candidatus Woesearchaeota archaeon]MCF8013794.1 hypothetical protein [Candidatus Woesearchaeota archaeon]